MSEDENEKLPAELKALEAQLAALVPRADRLDRDRLMFLAGRASAGDATVPSRSVARRALPAAFAAMTGVAVVLAVLLVLPAEPQIVERIIRVPAEPSPLEAVADGMRPAPEHRAVETPRENRRIADSADARWSPGGSSWSWAGHRSAAARNRDRLLQEVLTGQFAGPAPRPSLALPGTVRSESMAYRDLLDDLLPRPPADHSPEPTSLPPGADS